jgi:hypothetical protein
MTQHVFRSVANTLLFALNKWVTEQDPDSKTLLSPRLSFQRLWVCRRVSATFQKWLGLEWRGDKMCFVRSMDWLRPGSWGSLLEHQGMLSS